MSPLVQDLAQDIRQGLRQLAKAPGFAAVAILTVAIGIGACTALFSVVDGVLLQPLEFDRSGRLVMVFETQLPKFPRTAASPGEFAEWRRQNTVFEDLLLVQGRGALLRVGDKENKIFGSAVTRNFFSAFNERVLLGRTFLPEEETAGHEHVLVLSHSLWQSQFGGRNDVLNQQVFLDNQAYTVVGVMSADAIDPFTRRPTFYTPFVAPAGAASDFTSHNLWPAGRLKPGISLATAQAEMNVIASRIAREHPATNKDRGAVVVPLKQVMTGGIGSQLFVLLGAVFFLLLIACVNVASLLLARASARQKEIAVRAALGAGRLRIVRQFLCESLLISIIGGVLGVLLASASLGRLVDFARHLMPRTEEVSLNGSVLAFTCGLMLIAGLVVGLFPALQATRGDLVAPLKEAGRGASAGRSRLRLRTGLVVVEIALALMLLTSAGLLFRSLLAMASFDQGLRTDHVFSNYFQLDARTRYDSPEKIAAFTTTALDRIQSLPHVKSVAVTSGLPMGYGLSRLPFALEGQDRAAVNDLPLADYYAISPGYLSTLSIPLVRGRAFNADDAAGRSPVALINLELARKLFPGRDPIGHSLKILRPAGQPGDEWRVIVGIVGDVKPRGPLSETGPQIYVPFAQQPVPNMTLVLLTDGDAPALPAQVRDAIHALDANIPFETIYGFDATIAYSWVRQRFSMTLFLIFSGIALVLAAIGIYGVMAYSVNQRTHEIGIRMALGAQVHNVLALVFGQGARIVALGLVIGAIGSLAGTRLLGALLFQTSAHDPLTFAAVAALLGGIALLACWLPARRATKVDPMIALRSE